MNQEFASVFIIELRYILLIDFFTAFCCIKVVIELV